MAELQNFLLREFKPTEKLNIDEKTDLFDAGLLDSFSVMQLVQHLESQLDIVFEYSDLRRDYFSNLGSLALLLEKKYGVRKAN